MRGLVGMLVGIALGQAAHKLALDEAVRVESWKDDAGIYESFKPMCNVCPPALMIETVFLDKDGRAEFEVPFSERPDCRSTRGLSVVGHEDSVEVYDAYDDLNGKPKSKIEGTKVICWGVR